MDLSALVDQFVTFITALSGLKAYAMILGVLLACGLGVPIPEDITLVSAGILAGIGNISLPGALLAGLIGVLIGDAFLFTLGRVYGRRVFKLPIFRVIFTPPRIAIAEKKVLENSRFICFTARFLPGLRSPVFLMSGVLGVRPAVFYGLDGFAALISVPIWVLIGWWFGQNIDAALAFAENMQKWVVSGLIVLVVGYISFKRLRKKKAKNKAANQKPA